MATRSTIWIKEKRGFSGIYCHWDGCPSNQLSILNGFYNTVQKAQALINLGALSSLHERLKPNENEAHNFDAPASGVCVAYHRDKGEELNIYRTYTFKECKEHFEEYNYFFDDDSCEWHYHEAAEFFKKY